MREDRIPKKSYTQTIRENNQKKIKDQMDIPNYKGYRRKLEISIRKQEMRE